MDERIDDVRAVMDAADIERGAVMGVSEGGSLATIFAATHPDRCTGLILYGAFARFQSWVQTDEDLERLFAYIDDAWGSGSSLPGFAPSKADDPAFRRWWGTFERTGGDPGAVMALMRMNRDIDIADVLPSVHVPTLVIHRTDDVTVDVEGGRSLAEHIEGARYVELPGADHLPFVGDNAERIIEEIEEFLTGARSAPAVDRVLATVLFTDIVDSTARADELGDRSWHDLLAAHDEVVRGELARFRGNEVKTLGDGFLATFDGPARAIHCALAIVEAVRPLGIEVRAGVHTGEVRFADGDVHGIGVHIASRVAGVAAASEVIVSRTVKDLIAGSGISLEDLGLFTLKGIPDEWRLFRAE